MAADDTEEEEEPEAWLAPPGNPLFTPMAEVDAEDIMWGARRLWRATRACREWCRQNLPKMMRKSSRSRRYDETIFMMALTYLPIFFVRFGRRPLTAPVAFHVEGTLLKVRGLVLQDVVQAKVGSRQALPVAQMRGVQAVQHFRVQRLRWPDHSVYFRRNGNRQLQLLCPHSLFNPSESRYILVEKRTMFCKLKLSGF